LKLSDVKAKVLIIDDDADVRSAVRMTLESERGAKLSFLEADNVPSGLKALKSANPEVVILDIHMPGEDGFDFMNRLKQDESLPQPKIIMLTADDSIKNVWRAEKKGIDAYHFIGKPFRSDDLQ
jgi:two-component system alkaline phosphatase synthesis response regulator PhoP